MALTLLDLPDSVILHIFRFFSYRELLISLSVVCQRFHAISRDPALWKRNLCHPLQADLLADKELGTIVRLGGKDITRLRVSQQKLIRGHCLSDNIDLFLYLRSLDLSGCTGLEPQPLGKLLGECGYRLHTLILDGIDIPDNVLETSEKHSASRIHYLSLKRCTGFTHVGLRAFLGSCKSLLVLFLDDLITKAVDPVLNVICNKCKNLRNLSLSGCVNLSKEALTWTCLLPHLNSLDMSSIPAVDTQVIAALAVRAGVLKKIAIAGCSQIKDEALMAMVEAGRDCHFEVLDLSSTNVTNFGIRTLFRSELGQRLRQITVDDCANVSTTGVMCLAALSRMERVTAIHVEPSPSMESMIKCLSSVEIFTSETGPPAVKSEEEQLIVSRIANKFSYKTLSL